MKMTRLGAQRRKLTKAGTLLTLFDDSDPAVFFEKQGKAQVQVTARKRYILSLHAHEVVSLLLKLPPEAIAAAVLKAECFDVAESPEVIKQLAAGLLDRLTREAAESTH